LFVPCLLPFLLLLPQEWESKSHKRRTLSKSTVPHWLKAHIVITFACVLSLHFD
jgi:hypothetical protein